MGRGNVRLAAVGLCLLAAMGCASGARYIVRQPNGGMVSIPENSDVWPTYYRSKADELMKKQFPGGYVVDREEEVVVGQTSTNHQSTDTHKVGPFTVDAQTQNAVETHDKTEYRITYHGN
jgi:hypothetical protein